MKSDLIHIETEDGERRVMTPKEHEKMVEKWGEDNLPYTILPIKKVYGGPEPYPPGYIYKNY